MAQQLPILQELDNLLLSLQSLKPPGVAKSKVDAITKLCTSNENSHVDRQQIADSIINAFKRSPSSHKLGCMYILDSVIRQWIAQGGPNNHAGIHKLTDNIPFLMEELINTIPDSQKERLTKLLDIWLGSKTFTPDMLNSFKQRLNAPAQSKPTTRYILEKSTSLSSDADLVVANAVQVQPTSTPTNGQIYSQPTNATPSNVGSANAFNTPIVASQPQFPTANPVAAPQSYPVNLQGINTPLQTIPVSQYTAAPVVPQQVPPAALSQTPVTQNGQPSLPALNAQQLQIIQSIVATNPTISADSLRTILAAMGIQLPGPAAQGGSQFVAAAPVAPPPVVQPPHDQQSYRERSRSPDYKRRRVTPPNRRESPTYGSYEPTAARNDAPARAQDPDRRDRGRGKGRDNYRKRSPPRERMASPGMMGNGMQQKPPPGRKPFGHDETLAPGRIRVLSRTLFIGGVSPSADETKLMSYIGNFGYVQSCIVNHDKRHAFLKLITHQDAINAKNSIDQRPEAEYRSIFERMNWAVGFGPTEFADYKKGESVLPIEVLTEADCKWLKTAEYGGTGGLEPQTGMVVEEPDIEIGAGPSSKAISRRGGHKGFSARGGGGDIQRRDRERGDRDNRRFDNHRGFRQERPQPPLMETNMPEPINIGPPPPVPTFGGSIPGFQVPPFR